MTRISVTVDGVEYSDEVENRTLLVQYLREQVGKTGTVVGCDTTNCGACTVHLDGRSVKSCTMLAVQADGHEVTTIEGLAQDGVLHPMQAAFHECHALQSGLPQFAGIFGGSVSTFPLVRGLRGSVIGEIV